MKGETISDRGIDEEIQTNQNNEIRNLTSSFIYAFHYV